MVGFNFIVLIIAAVVPIYVGCTSDTRYQLFGKVRKYTDQGYRKNGKSEIKSKSSISTKQSSKRGLSKIYREAPKKEETDLYDVLGLNGMKEDIDAHIEKFDDVKKSIKNPSTIKSLRQVKGVEGPLRSVFDMASEKPEYKIYVKVPSAAVSDVTFLYLISSKSNSPTLCYDIYNKKYFDVVDDVEKIRLQEVSRVEDVLDYVYRPEIEYTPTTSLFEAIDKIRSGAGYSYKLSTDSKVTQLCEFVMDGRFDVYTSSSDSSKAYLIPVDKVESESMDYITCYDLVSDKFSAVPYKNVCRSLKKIECPCEVNILSTNKRGKVCTHKKEVVPEFLSNLSNIVLALKYAADYEQFNVYKYKDGVLFVDPLRPSESQAYDLKTGISKTVDFTKEKGICVKYESGQEVIEAVKQLENLYEYAGSKQKKDELAKKDEASSQKSALRRSFSKRGRSAVKKMPEEMQNEIKERGKDRIDNIKYQPEEYFDDLIRDMNEYASKNGTDASDTDVVYNLKTCTGVQYMMKLYSDLVSKLGNKRVAYNVLVLLPILLKASTSKVM